MNCSMCGECVLTGDLVPFQVPSGGVIHVCDTCAVRVPGEAVESGAVAPARAELAEVAHG